jgi:hypothetical protein
MNESVVKLNVPPSISAVRTPIWLGGHSNGAAKPKEGAARGRVEVDGHRPRRPCLTRSCNVVPAASRRWKCSSDPRAPFRRRTRVIALPNNRLGIRVRVDVEGRRRPVEGGIVITSSGALAPEWPRSGEPPRGNPFAFGPSAALVGLALCAVLLLVLFA